MWSNELEEKAKARGWLVDKGVGQSPPSQAPAEFVRDALAAQRSISPLVALSMMPSIFAGCDHLFPEWQSG
jgi:hypothetical protein